MTDLKVPIDCVQVSLSLDRSVLSSLSTQNLELFLMNNLLNQCMGTLSFSSNKNADSPSSEQELAVSERVGTVQKSPPSKAPDGASAESRNRCGKRKCAPGQKLSSKSKIISHSYEIMNNENNCTSQKQISNGTLTCATDSSLERFCPKVTNVMNCLTVNHLNDNSSSAEPENASVIDLSPETKTIALAQTNGLVDNSTSRVVFNHTHKVYPSTAPPLRVQVPCNDAKLKSTLKAPLTTQSVDVQSFETNRNLEESSTEYPISTLGDELRALFPPEDDENEESSFSSASDQGHFVGNYLNGNDKNVPVVIKAESFDNGDERLDFLTSVTEGLESESIDAGLYSTYDSFELADEDGETSALRVSANDAIENLAILDQLLASDDGCSDQKGKNLEALRQAVKRSVNSVSSMNTSLHPSSRSKIRSRGCSGSGLQGVTKKRQNRLRIHCSICSYNSDRGANVVRHYVLVHKLPDPVAKLVVKGLRASALNTNAVDSNLTDSSLTADGDETAAVLSEGGQDEDSNCQIAAS